MTPEEKLELVQKNYALQHAGDHAAAYELLTDDFFIAMPPYMPFGGVYRGKDAFRELGPVVAEAIGLTNAKFVATAVGDDYAVEIVELTLADHDGPPVQVLELNRFRGNQICEVRAFYFDVAPILAAAEKRKQTGKSPE